MHAKAVKYLHTLSNTFDDDIATAAVEGLIELGNDAAPDLRAMLSLDVYLRGDNCDAGERLYYIMKALRRIGDTQSAKAALKMYRDLDAHAEQAGHSNFDYRLWELLSFAREMDRELCSALPEVSTMDAWGQQRGAIREFVTTAAL